ncbi:MAG: radical SAM protein [Kiritimatiellaeota bacterium]|nr:radical SAM protein [Kiritimatiellota bacterium]
MKITFILPCVGRHHAGEPYVRSWSMEPLAIAVLAGLTPPDVERKFYDDRFDTIPYDEPTDLVALSVETYTARRAYQIAARFRERGVKVVMGGFHPTLMPDEVVRHADAVVLGEAEESWPRVVADARAGRLQARYASAQRPSLAGLRADRSIYAGKPYLPVTLIETSRGCPHACEFCSISQFFGRTWNARPVAEVVAEIRALKPRTIFFTDDNLMADRLRAKALLRALTSLKVRWAAQVTLDAAGDKELVGLMQDSGCAFVLVGFESLNPAALAAMGKDINRASAYAETVRRLGHQGTGVYGTFVFGYDGDTAELVLRGLQSHCALSGHAALRAAPAGATAAFTGMVARTRLSLRPGDFPTCATIGRGPGALLLPPSPRLLPTGFRAAPGVGQLARQLPYTRPGPDFPDPEPHDRVRDRPPAGLAAGATGRLTHALPLGQHRRRVRIARADPTGRHAGTGAAGNWPRTRLSRGTRTPR